MGENLVINSDGSEITSSNYWGTHQAKEGYYILSPNNGAFRLLIPQQAGSLKDMQKAKEIVITHGIVRKSWMPNLRIGEEMLEVMFDDHTDEPFVLYLSIGQLVSRPAKKDYNKWWNFTCWENSNNTPHKTINKKCYLRQGELQNMAPAPEK